MLAFSGLILEMKPKTAALIYRFNIAVWSLPQGDSEQNGVEVSDFLVAKKKRPFKLLNGSNANYVALKVRCFLLPGTEFLLIIDDLQSPFGRLQIAEAGF